VCVGKGIEHDRHGGEQRRVLCVSGEHHSSLTNSRANSTAPIASI
jgi:hypothetical protein